MISKGCRWFKATKNSDSANHIPENRPALESSSGYSTFATYLYYISILLYRCVKDIRILCVSVEYANEEHGCEFEALIGVAILHIVNNGVKAQLLLIFVLYYFELCHPSIKIDVFQALEIAQYFSWSKQNHKENLLIFFLLSR